jgi:monoamine oxidase
MSSIQYDVIIVGAGAAGLMALYELSKSGYHVCVLEASDRAGGRMATIHAQNGEVLETGAEFIHGKAPLTKKLLEEAAVSYSKVVGKMCTIRNGVWFPEEGMDDSFEKFQEKLEALEQDCSIATFLDKYFPAGEYDLLRSSITGIAEGFDLADINRASVHALRKEFDLLDEEQFRLDGGYKKLVQYLIRHAGNANAVILYEQPVHTIDYHRDHIIATTNKGEFTARKIVLTASAGVLQSGAIKLTPRNTRYEEAIAQLGFGAVVKLVLQFSHPFWLEKDSNIGFILSDEKIPTWWTQLPAQSSVLTGWLGGPPALGISMRTEMQIYELALDSLAGIFGKDKESIRNLVREYHILCWSNNEFSKGGYSYNTFESGKAKKQLQIPIDNKVYFAGEAIYAGESQGTVEAALSSGAEVASLIMKETRSHKKSG